ncbi:hypothetical protein ASG39_04695 [Rhizobium sp. Leaf371]|uniref:hypothetical protein n=1 Tax=Rhizobium sp. Leaf371 TaxID=1736355 RepID=UPI00071431FB|nr:hypothetical protein [Rhizobium sp. Leaf371]KQS73020.1 hypothetical protein ASG39_04695 [Rhizobium sp. Leaf371]
MTATAALKTTDQPVTADVLARHIIQEHDGDSFEAIKTLVLELDFARDQLHIASRLLSTGIGRGWKPSFERVPDTAPEA